MLQYQELVKNVLENGIDSEDRTGTGTKSLFGSQMRFNLAHGFPLVTIKKTYWKGVVMELLWLMRGETNINNGLKNNGVHIWDEWADENGDLGPVYGQQWREWAHCSHGKHCPECISASMFEDQLKNVIERIKTNPNCRRLIVSAWNPTMIDKMKLPPCHMFFQFYVRDGKLSCHMYQRSADLFLGVPFNIASYALLTHLVANECGLKVGEFVHTFGDVHLYNNHLEQARELLTREPKAMPRLHIGLPMGGLMKFIDELSRDLTWPQIREVIQLEGYESHPALKGEVSV